MVGAGASLDASVATCTFLIFFLNLVGAAGVSLDASGAVGAVGASLDASGAVVTWTFFGFFLARFGFGGAGGGGQVQAQCKFFASVQTLHIFCI